MKAEVNENNTTAAFALMTNTLAADTSSSDDDDAGAVSDWGGTFKMKKSKSRTPSPSRNIREVDTASLKGGEHFSPFLQTPEYTPYTPVNMVPSFALLVVSLC